MPTLLAAANGGVDTGIQAKLKKGGVQADGKTFKAHLDGHNQMDLLTGKGPGARKQMLYFSGDGDLCAIRMGEWKITFVSLKSKTLEKDRHTTVSVRSCNKGERHWFS